MCVGREGRFPATFPARKCPFFRASRDVRARAFERVRDDDATRFALVLVETDGPVRLAHGEPRVARARDVRELVARVGGVRFHPRDAVKIRAPTLDEIVQRRSRGANPTKAPLARVRVPRGVPLGRRGG